MDLSSNTPPRPHPLHRGDGRLVGQCLHASTCSQPPSNFSIHRLTLCLVLLANKSHHSVLISKSSSLVVTDSSTDTLLPLPLLLVPLLHESSFSSFELGCTASLNAQSNTICHDAMSLFCSTLQGVLTRSLGTPSCCDLLELCKLRYKQGPVHAAVTQPNACSRLLAVHPSSK